MPGHSSASTAAVQEPNRIRPLTARFENDHLEAAYLQANLRQARSALAGVTAIAILAYVAAIYGAWTEMTEGFTFRATTAARVFALMVHVAAMVVYLRAPRASQVLGTAAGVVALGCVAIALRLEVPPAGAEGLAALFHVTRDGIILLLFTATMILVLVPGWYATFALVFSTAFAAYLVAVHLEPMGPEYPANLTYASLAAFAFVLAIGNGVHRLRRDNFATHRRLRRANEKLARLATTDELTGCVNRRRFLEQGALELEQSRRHGHPLTLLAMDVDRFKAINDRYGHGVGDDYLRAFVKTIEAALRKGDVLGRVGGEEFAVLLPRTPLKEGQRAAERIRKEVASMEVSEIGMDRPTTVSIGVTGQARQDRDLANLIRRADEAMYEAKRTGRDRVVVASAPGEAGD